VSELRYTRILRALYRPNLVAGGERELVLMTGFLCADVAISSVNLPGVIGASVVWVLCLVGLRMMAKADPQMSKVYRRHIQYNSYYPPRSRPWRIDKK